MAEQKSPKEVRVERTSTGNSMSPGYSRLGLMPNSEALELRRGAHRSTVGSLMSKDTVTWKEFTEPGKM